MADTVVEHLPVDKLLASLIGIPSLSFEEGKVADFLQRHLEGCGIQVERKRDNIIFRIGTGHQRLLLNSHLDTVPPSDGHPFPPFCATIRGDRLYGRGAVDAKGSVACMVSAALELQEEQSLPDSAQLVVALTTCEERGKEYNGLQDVLPDLGPVDAALVGEPTEMFPCVSQKGLLILNLTARGKSAHAARGHLGVNAITVASRDVLKLDAFEFGKADPYLGPPTMHVTVIQGGTVHNVIPDQCIMKVDIRTTPVYSHSELVTEISALVESEVEVHSQRFIPVSTDPMSSIAQAALLSRPDAAFFGSPTTSDWIFLSGIPTVKMGVGQSELSHTADEHVPIPDLFEAVDGYKRVIKTYFGS